MFSLIPHLLLAGQAPAENGEHPTPDFLTSWSEGASEEPMFGQVIMALFLVLLLICFCAWLLKRFYPGSGKGGTRRRMKVVETLPLGRKRMIQVLKVCDRTMVVGITGERIELLTELSEEEAEAIPPAEEQEGRKSKGSFAEIFPFRRKRKKIQSAGGELL